MLRRAGKSLQALTEKNMYWDPTVQPVTHNDKVLDRLMHQQQQATLAYARKRRLAAKLKKQQDT